MEDNLILITWLNDFIFCPVSIFFHNLYGDAPKVSFQDTSQINGSAAHERIDNGSYSTRPSVLSGISVFCEQYGLLGKIDILDTRTGELVERKKRIRSIYDGYVFQLYGQYFALKEMGYSVKKITLRSMDDNKRYPVPLPEEDLEMMAKFEHTIQSIREFDITAFTQENSQKCSHCIYEPLCDCSLLPTEG